jgi:hypothetical protein
MMRTILALFSLLACVYATALTYRLEAHEKACYFAQVEHKGTKLAFYFAVRIHVSGPERSFWHFWRTGYAHAAHFYISTRTRS